MTDWWFFGELVLIVIGIGVAVCTVWFISEHIKNARERGRW